MKAIIISGLVILGVAIVTTISILMLIWASGNLDETDFNNEDDVPPDTHPYDEEIFR